MNFVLAISSHKWKEMAISSLTADSPELCVVSLFLYVEKSAIYLRIQCEIIHVLSLNVPTP